MHPNQTPNRGGRPRNPTDPESAHRAEILAWVALNSRTRKLLEKQLAYFEKKLADPDAVTMNMEGMLEIMSGLGTLVTTGNRVVEQGLKALDRPRGGAPVDDDPEAIMADLTGGKGG